MNAVEIEEAVCQLAETPFDRENFPFEFLEAFGNKPTTIKRLQKGSTNQSDIQGAVLQRNNIHLKVCQEGKVGATLDELRKSQATIRHKAKYILATDGKSLEAENLVDGETVVCESLGDLPDHFGFFLTLAGISTVKEIRENAFDIKATGRLNRLYVELLKTNPDWDKAENKKVLNHFMARLIFCFFAEDTKIFTEESLFTKTVERMSSSDSSNTHEVISEIFRSMCTPQKDRNNVNIRNWAKDFPYVNGKLFSGGLEAPRFSKIARSYIIHIGNLDWKKINPDIFGSMIQAVADEDERSKLGMHYTSIPNILKVLNPLFLDELREQLNTAGDNKRKLLNLRRKIARIRVFDPACGSGNFLVIAYKELRKIENNINLRRGEAKRTSDIELVNFRGIEIRHFSAEIARLALTIAKYQCDVNYLGLQLALETFLPLKDDNWIIHRNALRVDWEEVCPIPQMNQPQIKDSFHEHFGDMKGEIEKADWTTYICGNPPYLGSTWQSNEQKDDLQKIFEGRTKSWKSLDYVAGWFMKAADFGRKINSAAAFVSTSSICQGQQVPILWPLLLESDHEIFFAHAPFKWTNLATHNAGVTVIIVGIKKSVSTIRKLYSDDNSVQEVSNINPYLVGGPNIIVCKATSPISELGSMDFGSKPVDGGNLFLDYTQKLECLSKYPSINKFIKSYSNSDEFINGKQRYCLWIEDNEVEEAITIPEIENRLKNVTDMRADSNKKQTKESAEWPHRFGEIRHKQSKQTIVVPRVSSESRPFLPAGITEGGTVIGDRNFAIYDGPLWNLALIASRLHWVWIGTVCVRLGMSFSYSNTLGWNTFPVPALTDQNKEDLNRCAQEILLARESHFPATIADLYESENMPENLRDAHERNDEVLERIYIGRRFKNDTERLEKLFELYTKMAPKKSSKKKGVKK